MKAHTVGEVMTSEVVQARRTTSFKEVVRLLDHHRISGLPVVDDDDKVVGVVSGTDLVREQAVRAGGPDRPATAGDMMTSPAITIHPEQPVPDAARMMERHGVERLPVVDEEDRLIGIATRRDLLRVFLRTDEDIRDEVGGTVIAGELGLPDGAVDVSVRDGVVTLRGCVELRSQAPAVLQAAWRVEGVIGVVGFLTYRVDDCDPAVLPA
ncbi:CBS domain-containing protein [Streptomyces naganishii]|uniref:CBS domain-containing protein n=1 Tax=Streptomyces naganishii JCM 4654 TaxID=1306179 RepID=A0A918YAT4_9ACTN|nr:CBS domain-containing protein [Streptomyces naganishii]GHD97212.1 hypothetical protein GCM10010508_68920 [Streptomyces naganishii JCM 4654]